MLQKHLSVIAVGEPNFDTLTDGEKQTFFETLFSRIVEINKKNKKNQALNAESVD